MNKVGISIAIIMTLHLINCNQQFENSSKKSGFNYFSEQFADAKILRYKVPGFESLSLNQKKFLYYLSQAAYFGREVYYDQNYKHNLTVKRTLESILKHYEGDRETDDFKEFMVYTKRVWFSNGIHHHYAMDKFAPKFSKDFLAQLIKNSPKAKFPTSDGETLDYLIEKLNLIIFDLDFDNKRKSIDPEMDMVQNSANNLYEDVTQAEVENYYKSIVDSETQTPVSYGLNSKLVKEGEKVVEKVYRIGGMYSVAIEKIVFWLKKAATVAESEKQKNSIEKLIEFYKTGSLEVFDEYCKLWVQDIDNVVDFTNGFIEMYDDPMGYTGSWQSMVYFKDPVATKQFGIIADEAGWFEKHSTIHEEYKKENPKGITFKVINVVAESGDCSPTSPLGVNLPNSEWIREQYGSKSVSLANIEHAYDEALKSSGMLEEFHTTEQVKLIKKHGALASTLHTGLHEVIGHGSGKLAAGVASPSETLKNYANIIEETRADLVALYYIIDPHLVEMGLTPSKDVGKAEYANYIVNGLMKQLTRIDPGANIEQAHMRNRQLISKWVLEKGKEEQVIEKVVENNKTYFSINDYHKLRVLFGELLKEIQRIKSEGDYIAAKNLVEDYGVVVDSELHSEILERFKKLDLAPYSGFINPKLVPVMEGDEIKDIKIEYPADFTDQMMEYAEKYRILPNYN